MAFSTDVAQTLSPSGSKVSNVVRNTAFRQVTKYIKSLEDVQSLTENSISKNIECVVNFSSVVGTDCSSHYKGNISVGDETADYFYGVNVDLGDSSGHVGEYFSDIGKRILVVEGGNLLINEGVYDKDGDDQVVIVVLSAKNNDEKEVGGNVYIADDVTTLSNVVIIAEGSVHPFPAKSTLIDNQGQSRLTDKGVLRHEDLVEFFTKTHQDSSQLFIKGAVSAKTSDGISSMIIHNERGNGEHLNGAYEAVNSILEST